MVLPSERGDSNAEGSGRAGRSRSEGIKPEAATAVVELLMIAVRTTETC